MPMDVALSENLFNICDVNIVIWFIIIYNTIYIPNSFSKFRSFKNAIKIGY